MEFIDGCCPEFREWDTDLDPAPSRQIAGKLPEGNRVGEAPRKFGNLETLPSIGEDNHREICGGYRLRCITPEVKCIAGKLRKTIPKINEVHFSFPAASRLRSPLQSKGIRWRKKNLILNRQLVILKLERTWSRSVPRTVKVRIRRLAIVKKSVPIVLSVCMGVWSS
jgi:hypothetical protein